MADLASIISGTDPLAPLILRAEQQQQLLNSARDASQWQNQGPFGALARTIAGIRGGGDNPALDQIVQQRAAAMPSVFQALASPNAYQYGAAHPETSPVGLASILANAPGAARAGLEGAQGGLARNELASYGALGAPSTPGILKSPGLTPVPTAPEAPPSLANGASLSPATGATGAAPALPAVSEEMIQGATPVAQSILNYANTLPKGAARGRALLGQPPAVQEAARRLLRQQPAGASQ